MDENAGYPSAQCHLNGDIPNLRSDYYRLQPLSESPAMLQNLKDSPHDEEDADNPSQ